MAAPRRPPRPRMRRDNSSNDAQGPMDASTAFWAAVGGAATLCAGAAYYMLTQPAKEKPAASARPASSATLTPTPVVNSVTYKEVLELYKQGMDGIIRQGVVDERVLEQFQGLRPKDLDVQSRILICKFFLLYIQIKKINYAAKDAGAGRGAVPKRPPPEAIRSATKWIDYTEKENFTDGLDDTAIGETINLLWRTAYLARDIKAIERLYAKLLKIKEPTTVASSPHTFYYQRLFHAACLLGHWDNVEKVGTQVARFTEVQDRRKVPLLQRYFTEAIRNPKEYVNYTELLKKADTYKLSFPRRLQPPLRFEEWIISSFKTKLVEAVSTNPEQQTLFDEAIAKGEWKDVYASDQIPKEHRKCWVTGAVLQVLCPSKGAAFPLVGPWNDVDMSLSAEVTYMEREKIKTEGKVTKDPRTGMPSNLQIKTIKMPITLQLERQGPAGPRTTRGWKWTGTLECPRKVLNQNTVGGDLASRRWELLYTQKFDIELIVDSPT